MFHATNNFTDKKCFVKYVWKPKNYMKYFVFYGFGSKMLKNRNR